MVFVTYSGPHTGVNEATPVAKVMGQYLSIGALEYLQKVCTVASLLQIRFEYSGRMGDIRGKPTAEELAKVKSDAQKLAQRL
jgi:hypothetical protein